MIGLKARSTLVPAEEWVKDFIPYGPPGDEPCEELMETGAGRLTELEQQLAEMKAELAAMKAAPEELTKRSGTDD